MKEKIVYHEMQGEIVIEAQWGKGKRRVDSAPIWLSYSNEGFKMEICDALLEIPEDVSEQIHRRVAEGDPSGTAYDEKKHRQYYFKTVL